MYIINNDFSQGNLFLFIKTITLTQTVWGWEIKPCDAKLIETNTALVIKKEAYG